MTRFHLLKNLLLVLALCFGWRVEISSAATANWKELTNKAASEGPERKQAISELRKIKDLDQQIEKALKSPDQDIAIHTIVILKLTQFTPQILDLTASDFEGSKYSSLNALIDPQTKSSIATAYRKRLAAMDSHKGAGAKIAILQGLQSMQEELPKETLETLLDDSSYEVRTAAVQYAGAFSADFSKNGYSTVLQKALEKKPYQLRLTAAAQISSLPTGQIKQQGYRFENCLQDSNMEVKQACEALARRVKQP